MAQDRKDFMLDCSTVSLVKLGTLFPRIPFHNDSELASAKQGSCVRFEGQK